MPLSTPAPPPRLADQGGPVEVAPVTIYPIFYGTWRPSDPQVALVTSFLEGLPRSTAWRVLDGYGVTSQVNVAPPVFPGAPFGVRWHSSTCTDVVNAAFTGEAIATNIPLVYVSSDVVVPDWGTRMCGYHSAFHSGTPFIFTGDPAGKPGCAWDGARTLLPSASTLYHELGETLTDPELDAWIRPSTMGEIGDLCAWRLIPTPDAPEGYHVAAGGLEWNVNVSGKGFLLQSLWDATAGACSLGSGEFAPAVAPAPAPAPAGLPPYHGQRASVQWLVRAAWRTNSRVHRPGACGEHRVAHSHVSDAGGGVEQEQVGHPGAGGEPGSAVRAATRVYLLASQSVVSSNNNGQATYDAMGEGPSFGAGRDIYVQSDMRVGYCSQSTYNGPWGNVCGQYNPITLQVETYFFSPPDAPPTTVIAGSSWLAGAALCGSATCQSQGMAAHLCYSTAVNGWSSVDWHGACNYKGTTLTVYTLGDRTIAFSMDRSWTATSSYSPGWMSWNGRSDTAGHLYFIAQQYVVNQQGCYTAYDQWSYGPTFGCGPDISVDSNMHIGDCSNGNSFPAQWGNICGSRNPTTVQIETYYFVNEHSNNL